MKTNKFIIPKDTIIDVAIDFGSGYILHANTNESSGVLTVYKVQGEEKEHVQTIILSQ